MFRATNKTSGEEIVILDEKWKDQINHLRSLSKSNILVCPGCKQPVRVKAGRRKRRHFAHKHLQNCPYGYESPGLLNTRAILYRWLVSKLGNSVCIEKRFEASKLPRHIDCWVETEKHNFAYWIIEAGMKPKKRDCIRSGLGELNAQVHWVFVGEMLREDTLHSECIHLTTTEREFMKQSDYDEFRFGTGFVKGKSLHYLNPKEETLISYRKLHLVHSPQLYQGQKISNNISSVLVSPKTGEFVYPGERDELEELKKEKMRFEKEHTQQEKLLEEVRQNFFQLSDDSNGVDVPNFPLPAQDKKETSTVVAKEAACILCGQLTTDYWYHNRKDNTCKCRECYRDGRYVNSRT